LGRKKKLAEVVAKKAVGKGHNPGAGICKAFIAAVESNKYGWFWECPNGEKCLYRHALPPGFKLKRDQPKEEKVVERAIEDIIEEEKLNLLGPGTPMNEENFKQWRAKILAKREKEAKKDRAAALLLGKKTGRQLLEESGDSYLTEEGDEEGFDLEDLFKQRRAEEDALDKENAELVIVMQQEMQEAERESEKRVEKEVQEELAAKKKEQEEHGTTTTITTTTTETTSTELDTTASNTLVGVDTSLFTGEEDLPEFDD